MEEVLETFEYADADATELGLEGPEFELIMVDSNKIKKAEKGSKLYNNCTDVIALWTADSCQPGGGGTIARVGDVRMDNQGDVFRPDGKKYANIQVQKGSDTYACGNILVNVPFMKRRIRNALVRSLDEQKVAVYTVKD